jgi:hypothetical protein
LAEQQGLAEDQRGHRQVHRVADVPLRPANHEALGRCDGRRSSDAFDHEPRESVEQHRESYSCDHRAQERELEAANRAPPIS